MFARDFQSIYLGGIETVWAQNITNTLGVIVWA